MFWDGKRWQYDDSGQIKRLADEVCEDLKQEAFLIADEDMRDKALKFALKTAGSNPKENMSLWERVTSTWVTPRSLVERVLRL